MATIYHGTPMTPRAALLDHLAAACPAALEPKGAGGYVGDNHRVHRYNPSSRWSSSLSS